MDDLIKVLVKHIKLVKIFIYKLYYKILFLLNKQKTLQKIYEPLLKDKYKINEQLLNKLNRLKSDNKFFQEKIQRIMKENSELKHKISVIQEILIQRDL